MSVREGLLALLAEAPKHGYQLKQEFEATTAGIWPLNIGQVYTTLDRLERDGLVALTGDESDGRKQYLLTDTGRVELEDWFSVAVDGAPQRDSLIIKVLVALHTSGVDANAVIDTQRSALFATLQQHRRAQRKATVALESAAPPPAAADSASPANGAAGNGASAHGAGGRAGRAGASSEGANDELSAALLFDALVTRVESDLRWLDLCEERIASARRAAGESRARPALTIASSEPPAPTPAIAWPEPPAPTPAVASREPSVPTNPDNPASPDQPQTATTPRSNP